MYYIYYQRSLHYLGGKKWEIKSYSCVSLATDDNYEKCCGKETIKFFRRVFGSKETTTRLSGGITRHTSQLNNEKSEHYFVPISSGLYDLIKDLKTNFKLRELAKQERQKLYDFLKSYYKTTNQYTEMFLYFIELYNKMYDLFFEFK